MLSLTPEAVAEAMKSKGYAVFENEAKGYDLNLFGVRAGGSNANAFDDVVGVMYRAGGRWVLFALPATTDPGTYWREHPMNVKGTAILKPGQYRGAYKVGRHKGYPALVQAKPVTVYRDNDGDDELDTDGDTQTGMFGINIHRANADRSSVVVGRWSAGCQVVADPLHFGFLLQLARRAKMVWGNAFTYTLLEEADL